MDNKYLDIGRLEGFLLAHNAPAIVMDSFHYLTNNAFPVTKTDDLLRVEIPEAPSNPYKYRKPRKPLSEENKAKLRKQLENARIAKAIKKSEEEAKKQRVHVSPPPSKPGKPKN